jgi:hypothetical protein
LPVISVRSRPFQAPDGDKARVGGGFRWESLLLFHWFDGYNRKMLGRTD